MSSLLVHSIFRSIDGEANQFGQGCPTTFIRLGGCNMACVYCDTKDTQPLESPKYELMGIDRIINTVAALGLMKVTITGGEPLVQQEKLIELCTKLDALNISTTIETNGTIIPASAFAEIGANRAVGFAKPLRVLFVADRKCPSSGIPAGAVLPIDANWWVGFTGPRRPLYLKYVIGSEEDFRWTCADLQTIRHQYRYRGWEQLGFPFPTVLFSAVHGKVEISTLFDWAVDAQETAVLFNVQIHKLVGMP